MSLRRVYKNPPIKEVVCEFRFTKNGRWDATIPGIIYEDLKDEYPKKVHGKELEIGISKDSIEHTFRVSDRVKFTNKEETILIQIGPHHLIINLLTKYTSWEDYMKKINRILSSFIDALGSNDIERINLNYINEIQVPQKFMDKNNSIQLDSLFDFYPFLGKNLSWNYSSFIIGVQFPKNNKDILQMQMEGKEEKILLDLSYFINNSDNKGINVNEWLNRVHDSIIDAFESCIKDPLREEFKVVK